jgi:hypothetical protein
MDDPVELTTQAANLRSEAAAALSQAEDDERGALECEAIALDIEGITEKARYEVEAHKKHVSAARLRTEAEEKTTQATDLEAQAQTRSFELADESHDKDLEASAMSASGGDDEAAMALSREADDLHRRASGV